MTQQSNQNQHAGFTLVELMLAMSFVAMLLLAIAGVVLQIAGTYHKGTTMQAVNQAGRAIVTDMRRTVASGKPFVPQTAFIQQRVGGATTGAVKGGRLCTGTYTYVWNIAADASANASNQINRYSGTDGATLLRFIKVVDNGATYCQLPAGSSTYPDITKADATELFADSNLAVQCLQLNHMQCQVDTATTTPLPAPTPLTTSPSMQLYDITMLLSSADQTAINTAGACIPPTEVGSYENYCAVNEFDFTVQAGNGGGQ